MKSPRSISFSANLYADKGSENVVLWVHQFVSSIAVFPYTAHCVTPSSLKLLPFWELSHKKASEIPFTFIEQFSREKSIWIFPVPSEIVAKHIFPNDRWSMTRPASETSLFGALMISSTVRNSLIAPPAMSMLEGYFASIFPRELVISNLVAKGFTPSALMRSSFRMRSRVSVE